MDSLNSPPTSLSNQPSTTGSIGTVEGLIFSTKEKKNKKTKKRVEDLVYKNSLLSRVHELEDPQSNFIKVFAVGLEFS